LELVVATHSLAEGLPPEQVAKVPDAPELGAVNVTLTPETPLPPEAVTFATSGEPKALFTVAVWGVPDDVAIAVGCPRLLMKTDEIPDATLPRVSVARR
jgi:hypothetical protein